MRQAPVLENNSKELRLYVTNIRPHNMIFFKDNKFMEYVKKLLWDEYHIGTIILNRKESVKSACGIANYEYNDELTGVMYFMSVAVIDPYMEMDNDEYCNKVYNRELCIDLGDYNFIK